MATALLLIIVAILLFGSSAVIGAAGAILGFLSLVVGLTLVSILLSIPPEYVVGGAFALVAILGAIAHHYHGPKA